MAEVSVILPTYNCAQFLTEAARSVLRQSLKDLELIIINDGSCDNTDEIIKELEEDKRMIYLRNDRKRGLSFSRNRGVRAASSNFIALLDADDIFFPEKLEQQTRLMKRKKCLFSYTNQVYFNGSGMCKVSNRYHFSGDVFYYLKRSNFIPSSSVMFARSLFKHDMFDEDLPSHEDWDFYLRISSKGVRFCYLKDPLCKIRVRRDSMTAENKVMNDSREEVGRRARALWKDFKKHISLLNIKGWRFCMRYIRMKASSFVLRFPKAAKFNRIPQSDIE